MVLPVIPNRLLIPYLQLHNLINQAASKSVVKTPSAKQKKKVEGLVKAEKNRTRFDKVKRSAVKQSRRGRSEWDYWPITDCDGVGLLGLSHCSCRCRSRCDEFPDDFYSFLTIFWSSPFWICGTPFELSWQLHCQFCFGSARWAFKIKWPGNQMSIWPSPPGLRQPADRPIATLGHLDLVRVKIKKRRR